MWTGTARCPAHTRTGGARRAPQEWCAPEERCAPPCLTSTRETRPFQTSTAHATYSLPLSAPLLSPCSTTCPRRRLPQPPPRARGRTASPDPVSPLPPPFPTRNRHDRFQQCASFARPVGRFRSPASARVASRGSASAARAQRAGGRQGRPPQLTSVQAVASRSASLPSCPGELESESASSCSPTCPNPLARLTPAPPRPARRSPPAAAARAGKQPSRPRPSPEGSCPIGRRQQRALRLQAGHAAGLSCKAAGGPARTEPVSESPSGPLIHSVGQRRGRGADCQ